MTDGDHARVEVQYWDTCLFIVFLMNLQLDRVKVLQGLIDQARASKPRLRIVLSNLVLAEIPALLLLQLRAAPQDAQGRDPGDGGWSG